MGDKHGLIWGFLNLSLFYLDQRIPEEVLLYAQKGLPYAQQTGDGMSLGLLYMNMGSAFRFKGELIQAEIYTREVEKLLHQYDQNQRYQSLYAKTEQLRRSLTIRQTG